MSMSQKEQHFGQIKHDILVTTVRPVKVEKLQRWFQTLESAHSLQKLEGVIFKSRDIHATVIANTKKVNVYTMVVLAAKTRD